MNRNILTICFCNIIIINVINANYPDQKCYICETNSCQHTSENDIKSCSLNDNHETSGKNFVSGALVREDANDIYDTMAVSLTNFGINQLGLNESMIPSWNSLTRWVKFILHKSYNSYEIILGMLHI